MIMLKIIECSPGWPPPHSHPIPNLCYQFGLYSFWLSSVHLHWHWGGGDGGARWWLILRKPSSPTCMSACNGSLPSFHLSCTPCFSFQTPLHLSLCNFTNLSFGLFVIGFAVTNSIASDILAVSFLGAYANSRKWNDQIGEWPFLILTDNANLLSRKAFS